MRLRLPPYAKAHTRAAREGSAPANGIAIAGDWSLTNRAAFTRAAWRAVCPEDHEPSEFDWRWCAAFDVILIARSQSRLDALATAIMPCGPHRLLGLLVSASPKTSWYVEAA